MAYYQNESDPILTLTGALQSQTVDTLKPLAKLVSTEKRQPTRKAELVDFIQHQLDDDNAKRLWQKLDKLQQAAVAETVHAPDLGFHADRFIAKYGRSPNWGTTDHYGYRRSPSLLCLFFYNSIMPDDLKRRLRAFVPAPEAVELKSQDDLPAMGKKSKRRWNSKTIKLEPHEEEAPLVRCPTERAACHDLKAVLRLIDSGKLTVSDKTNQPGVGALKAVNTLLLGGDFYDDSDYDKYDKIGVIKPFAWPLLVQAGGLAKLSGKRLELTRAGQKALNTPPENTLATLWRRWLKTKLLDELRRIDCIKGQTGKGKRGLTAVAGRRDVINAALLECPPGKWIAINDLFRQMRATDLSFEITRNPWSLYIADPNYGNLGDGGFLDWNILQARYVLCLLFEYAATLGLIDIAYVTPHNAREDFRDIWGTDDLAFFSRYDGLQFIRINPLGAYCLGMEQDYVPSTPEIRAILRVLPNLEIATIGESLEPADELLLNSYAKQVSDAVWKLEPTQVLEAVEAGQSISTLRELLESRSSQPLPETVIQFLDDMSARTESLQNRGAAQLIECTDAALAALIANDTRTKPHCLLAAERYLVVPAESENRFRSALRKLGYSLPK